MKFANFSLPLISVLMFIIFSGWSDPSQGQICSPDDSYEPPSDELRTVRLDRFGIEVDIPSNYRTMLRQNGSVEILHPDDFKMWQCVLNEGYGGRGYYSEGIQLINRDETMTLREQAIWLLGYSTDAEQTRIPHVQDVIEYNQGDLSGYIAISKSGYAVMFLGTLPGNEKLLQVDASLLQVDDSCDCSVDLEDLTDLLANIRRIEN